jgi:hypothetical protein
MYVGIVELRKMAEDDLSGVDTKIKGTEDENEIDRLNREKSELNLFLEMLALYRAK